jgi:hypothetical protein
MLIVVLRRPVEATASRPADSRRSRMAAVSDAENALGICE